MCCWAVMELNAKYVGVCVCVYKPDTPELSRFVTVCYLQELSTRYIYRRCVLAEEGLYVAFSQTSHKACWTGGTTALICWWEAFMLCVGMCVSRRMCSSLLFFFFFCSRKQEGDASDVLSFHFRVLLWGKRIPWKLNISLWLAADKDWIICVFSLNPRSIFFFLTGMKDFVCGALRSCVPLLFG